MNHLPPEKQLTHLLFMEKVKNVRNVEEAKAMLENLHLRYLKDQASVINMAKQEFGS